MALEPLAEDVRVERHLVGGDLHDAETVEEPAPVVPVGLHELVVGRGVAEREAGVAVDVREGDVDVVLVEAVEARALDEDAPQFLVVALDVRLLRGAVRVAVEDPRPRDEPERVVVGPRVLGHDGVGERGPVVLEDRGEELHEQRPPGDAVEHVDDARPRLGGLALLVEGEHELALELDREEDAAPDPALERVGLGDPDALVLLLPEDEEVVRPPDAALRVRLRLDGLLRGPAHARKREVSAPDVEDARLDVGVDRLLAQAAELVRVRDDDVPDGLALAEPVLDGDVHFLDLLVRGVDALAALVELRVAVGLRDLGDVELLRQGADALILASIADERGRDEAVAGARLELGALEEALVAVLAPLVHAAVRVAHAGSLALPVPLADRVRPAQPLVRVDSPRLELGGNRLWRLPDPGCDLRDAHPALEASFDVLPCQYGHLGHSYSFLFLSPVRSA